MKAIAVTPGVPGSAKLETVRDPQPTRSQLLVKTLEVGVCGTDRTIVAGGFGSPPAGHKRLVIGHEVLGTVRRGGGGYQEGDLVAATVRRPCGGCVNCDAGEVAACSTGEFTERGIIGLDGFASEFFAESSENLVAVPDSLGRLGVLGEPMSICERGWRNAMHVGRRQGWQPSKTLVLGVGAIGVLSAMIARLNGMEVWAYARRSPTSHRAQLMRSLGAEYASASDSSLLDLVAEIGRPDLILEAAGHSELTAEAISCLAPNGVLCIRGINPRPGPISVPATLFTDEIVLENKSIIGSTNAARRDWEQAYADLSAIATRWPDALSQVIGLTVDPQRFDEAIALDAVKATIRFA